MKVHKLDSARLSVLPKHNIDVEFVSNLIEGNKEVVELLPEINKIDSKIGQLCQDIFEKRAKLPKAQPTR